MSLGLTGIGWNPGKWNRQESCGSSNFFNTEQFSNWGERWRQHEKMLWIRSRLSIVIQGNTLGVLSYSLNTNRATLQVLTAYSVGKQKTLYEHLPLMHLPYHPAGFHLFWRRGQERTEKMRLGRKDRCSWVTGWVSFPDPVPSLGRKT